MLTLIQKQDRTIDVPYETISIDAVIGDPLGKAKFQVIDTNSLIPLSVLQEVIFWDETLQLQRITSVTYNLPANWSDSFSTNTSTSYTSTFNPMPPGSASTWTYGSGTLTASGGSYALYLLKSWLAASATISATMTTSDFGGLAFNVQDTQNYYEVAVRDASSGTVAYTDNFSTNTSTSYTSTFNPMPPGSASTWTYGSGTLTASGGSYALYLLKNWTATNVDLTVTMTTSDFGGIAWHVANTNNFYEIAVRDASSSAGANTFAFFKTVSGTRSSIGTTPTIAFIRGTSHTIRVTMSGSTITAYFDGTSKASFTDTSLSAGGQVGLRNDVFSGHSSAVFTSISFTDSDTGANTVQLYKTTSGTRAAIGSPGTIAFTRGTSHTIQVATVNTPGTSTVITVKFDGTTKITYTDSSSPLSTGQVGLRSDTFNLVSSAIFTAFTAISNDTPIPTYTTTTDTAVPSVNYLANNNFTGGSAGWGEVGTLTGRITFPSNGTYGSAAVATLTFANQAVGSDSRYQDNSASNAVEIAIIPGQGYCFSATVNVTSTFTNSYAFLQIVFLDYAGSVLSTITSPNITTTTGAQRFSVRGTAPTNAYTCRTYFGGTTTNTTNSGSCTFTALMLEPMWFPTLYNYPSPICDSLQIDTITQPDGTASRLSRIFAGFITHLTARYEGTTRIWDVECSAADLLLETSALINASYTNVTDISIIQGIINSLINNPLLAVDSTFASGTPQALAYRNTPICVAGATISALQFSDATIREVINALVDITGFTYGVDPYYNFFYYPPFYNQAPYAFSTNPDNTTTFPFYDYSIEYDGTQLHNAVRVVGTTFPTTVTESWHFQDGSHTEIVQSGKTVNVYLNNLPNAVPSLTVGGVSLSCGSDSGTGYGGASSLISSSVFGTPKLLSFPSPGYAAGIAISVTYAYDTLAYVQVQAPDSVAQYGQALYSKVNDTNLGSIASAVTRGEAELQAYAQPRITVKFKTQKMLLIGQVILFTSTPDGITNAHYTVNRVNATYLGNGLNQYEIEAGTYVDDFIDFFRNTQKAVGRVDHDPALAVQQINNLQQDSLSVSDSLNIHL